MDNVKRLNNRVYDECTELYSRGGRTAVCDHVIKQQLNNNSMYDHVQYKHCTPCESNQPILNNVCLVCGAHVKPLELGDTLNTVGELRELIKDLSDDDIIRVETCDEDGDVEDLYPMSLDVIEGIKLNDDTIVREVRFCQRPNSKPDTRDKQSIIDALLIESFVDNNTVLKKLLKLVPYELLINSLPKEIGEKLRETL